ncbi:site-specific integrase [Seramator thermalis]|jgi:integrase|uniref:site-specific integrase n=1 Tax=Seramator thermalis TaxID=2496270 RepID=UPI00101BD823|nr:site-specific integrase [Seramator thermalis]
MATNFYLDTRSNKKGDHPINVSIVIKGERLLTTTGYSISPDKWNRERQRVNQGFSNANGITYNVINNKLSEIESYFSKLENQIEISDTTNFNLKDEFAEKFRTNKTKKKAETIFDHMDEFISEVGKLNDWTVSTVEKFNALKNHLRTFNPALKYENLNESGLISFMDYLKNVPLTGDVQGMRNSTIKNRISFLKWFLRWATKKGYNNEAAFLSFNPKIKTIKSTDKEIVFLDWEELIRVYNFEFPDNKKYLTRVRDVFCFSCFTGLRYSDTANLKRSNIHETYISLTSIKDSDNLKIELNKYSAAILDKYKDEQFPYDRALPVISNQRSNEYLKEMAKLCGIDTPVTEVYYKGNERIEEVRPKYEMICTHTARRTFISNALMKGIPVNVVMKWTGHSDYNAMKPYIAIADTAKKNEMDKFNL